MTQQVIEQLELQAIPLGGYSKQTYVSDQIVQTTAGERRLSASGYYYLTCDSFCAWHRLSSDEIWYFHSGGGLTIHQLNSNGKLFHHRLGEDVCDQICRSPQLIIPAGNWFAAEVDNDNTYALLSLHACPSIETVDLEIAKAAELAAEYPQHQAIIERLCR